MKSQWYLIPYLIRTLDVANTPWATVLAIVGVLLCMIVPYLLGSINFGLLISQKKYHDDVRTHGSGNAGTTNMLRTYGRGAATLTLIGDMAKGVVAVLFGYLILGWNEFGYNESGQFIYAYDQVGAAIAGLFVMLGHMFPVFYKFKGGKGVATSMAVIACIDPVFTFSICGITYFAVLLGTRYVSLASCMTLILYPVFLSSVCTALGGVNPTACALAVVMALLVVFMHRENIKRLLAGNERKVSFKKKKKNPDGTVEDATSVDAPAAEAPAETKPNRDNKKNKSKKK